MLEFVDSGLYIVQDENNFINPLLQVGAGSGYNEKSTRSGSGGPKQISIIYYLGDNYNYVTAQIPGQRLCATSDQR